MKRVLWIPMTMAVLALLGCPGDMGQIKKDTGGNTIKKDTGGGIITDAKKTVDGAKDAITADSPPGCPPVPTCNWCNGTAVKDTKGCITGFKCLNGADPCKTNACTKGNCPKGQYCATDKLCWPYMDSGPATPDKKVPLCLNSNCKATPGKSCDCDWSCDDGTKYKATCTSSGGGYSCTCLTNAVKTGTCQLTTTCYQTYAAKCCGFSMQ